MKYDKIASKSNATIKKMKWNQTKIYKNRKKEEQQKKKQKSDKT